MTPTRPYFLRALYEWIIDNDCTPYLAVNATFEGVQVPLDYVENGEITLNLSSSAIIDLVIDDATVKFKARFNGIEHQISIPMVAVLGVYAKENGQGMLFPEEAFYNDVEPQNVGSLQGTKHSQSDDLPEPPKPAGKPNLTLIK